jgi:hypothetical protein
MKFKIPALHATFWRVYEKINAGREKSIACKFSREDRTLLRKILGNHTLNDSLIRVSGLAKEYASEYVGDSEVHTAYYRFMRRFQRDRIPHIMVGRQLYTKRGVTKWRDFKLTKAERVYWTILIKLNEVANRRTLKCRFTRFETDFLLKTLKNHPLYKSLIPLPEFVRKLFLIRREYLYRSLYNRYIGRIRRGYIPALKVGGRWFMRVETFKEFEYIELNGGEKTSLKRETREFKKIASIIKKENLAPTPELLITRFEMSGYKSFLFLEYYDHHHLNIESTEQP